jgi:hypothetical protein
MKRNKLFNFDLNCIFCKYKYSLEDCVNAGQNCYKCPSVSNIFYGKIIELPVIKQIYKYISDIQFEKEMKKYEEYYINENETEDMLYVWGIKSYDDLTPGNVANMYTMNDLDLIYHKDINKYSLGIETIYSFSSENGQYGYMQSLLDEFTKWMEDNNYNTNREFALFEVFTDGISIKSKFNSIEEAYAAFKMMVNGFCSLQNNTNESETN